jgi:hypothetical protein
MKISIEELVATVREHYPNYCVGNSMVIFNKGVIKVSHMAYGIHIKHDTIEDLVLSIDADYGAEIYLGVFIVSRISFESIDKAMCWWKSLGMFGDRLNVLGHSYQMTYSNRYIKCLRNIAVEEGLTVHFYNPNQYTIVVEELTISIPDRTIHIGYKGLNFYRCMYFTPSPDELMSILFPVSWLRERKLKNLL